MTQEEKQLLLKDLCARLYYRPNGTLLRTGFDNEEVKVIGYNGRFVEVLRKGDFDELSVDSVRLFLRPMSSMTEEEKMELSRKYFWRIDRFGTIQIRYHSEGVWDEDTECPTEEYLYLINWLNEHHFDYRGLIEKSLALEAPEGMYKTK